MDQAKKLATENDIEEMSLDHDLGVAGLCTDCTLRETSESEIEDPCDCRCKCHQELAPTGYDFVKWLCESERWSTVKPTVHSMNPVGAGNMKALINRYWFNPRLN